MSAKEAAITLTVMIFMVNLGLLAIQQSDTGLDVFDIGGGFTFTDLNASISSLKPPENPDHACDAGTEGFLCVLKGTFNTIAGAGQYAVFLLSSIWVFLTLLVQIVTALIAGWFFALMNLADAMEPGGTGAIHTLFMGLAAVITAIIVFAIFSLTTEAK